MYAEQLHINAAQLVDSVIDLARNLVIPTELIVMVRMYHHDEVLSSMVKVVSCFYLTWPCRDISMLNRKLFMIVVMVFLT